MEGAEQWVTWQWSKSRDRWPTVTVNNVFSKFQAIRKDFEKSRWTVTRQWSEVTRPLADCQTTFLDVSSNYETLWKESLNGHATVAGGHVTVGRLSNNVFGRFKQSGKFLKKVTERSRDSGRRSRDRRPTVKQRFWTFQAIRNCFEKSHWTVTRQWSEVTRPLTDCQTTFLDVSKQLRQFP